jgi:hypothetical protein
MDLFQGSHGVLCNAQRSEPPRPVYLASGYQNPRKNHDSQRNPANHRRANKLQHFLQPESREFDA